MYVCTDAVMTMCACACLANVIYHVVLGLHVCTNMMGIIYTGFVVYTCMQTFVELSSVHTSYLLSFPVLLCATRVFMYKHVNCIVVPVHSSDDTFNYRTSGIQYVDPIGEREEVILVRSMNKENVYLRTLVFNLVTTQ